MFKCNWSVIVGAARTPFGKLGGVFKDYSAVDLGAIAMREAVLRSGVGASQLDLIIFGQTISAACGQIPARQAALQADIPVMIPVDQINKVCASGLRALCLADSIIRAGDADIILTGGMESMSNAPFASLDLRFGKKMFNSEFTDLMVKDGLWCPYYNVHMAVHGGDIAREYGITREMQDEWAMESQKRANHAVASGYIGKEITPVQKKSGDLITIDEAPRKGVTMEMLTKLLPLFCDENTVTAGNAPGVNDGASAILIASEKKAKEEGLKPLARILGYATCSEDPKYIATAPGKAIIELLNRQKLKKDEIDLYEINEAFAAVTLVSAKIVGISADKINVNGGAIAYGHPLAASGGRIVMTLVNELKRRKLRYGIAAICSGMGQGDAVLIENLCI